MTKLTTKQFEYSARDRDFFSSRRIGLDEVDRQRMLLTSEKPHRVCAERACTISDGIRRIGGDERSSLIQAGLTAVKNGRLTDFVPASGAATRMFADLLEARKKGAEFLVQVPEVAHHDKTARAIQQIFESLPHFAFYPELREIVLKKSSGKVDLDSVSAHDLFRGGDAGAVISAIVDSEGLGLADMPKALIPFHRYGAQDVCTSLAEHLHTAAEVGADMIGGCRVHFTCSPEHMEGFHREAREVAHLIHKRQGVQFNLSFSIQDPSTDTVCVDEEGNLGRDPLGNPLLRPGGHGALLFNLERLGREGSDAVYINNIDNVHPAHRRHEFVDSKLLLLGVLSEVQASVHAAVAGLRTGMDEQGVQELYDEMNRQVGLGVSTQEWNDADVAARVSLLIDALDRPIRVVGVVKNMGEQGGGPFWVRGSNGRVTRQLVERHELDPADEQQQALFAQGTHFNPVRIMCGLKDHTGKPHELNRFVNQRAVLISEKSISGSRVKILERPGLWNGGMAEWITIFVEVDEATFAPVKSVADLAKPSHRC